MPDDTANPGVTGEEETPMAETWWICTDELAKGGEKILGPFGSRDLALEVRVYVEAHPRHKPRTYWVDQEQPR